MTIALRDAVKASERRAMVTRLHGDNAAHISNVPSGEELLPASAPRGSSVWSVNVLLFSVSIGVAVAVVGLSVLGYEVGGASVWAR